MQQKVKTLVVLKQYKKNLRNNIIVNSVNYSLQLIDSIYKKPVNFVNFLS